MSDQEEQPNELIQQLDAFVKTLTPDEDHMLKTILPEQLDRMKLHLKIAANDEVEGLPSTDDEIRDMLRQHRLALYMQIKQAHNNQKISRLPTAPEEFPLPALMAGTLKNSIDANAYNNLKHEVQTLLMMGDDELKDFVGEDLENLQDVMKCAKVLIDADTEKVYKELNVLETDIDDFVLPDEYCSEIESVAAKKKTAAAKKVNAGEDGTVITAGDMQDVADSLKDLLENDEN